MFFPASRATAEPLVEEVEPRREEKEGGELVSLTSLSLVSLLLSFPLDEQL